MSKSTLVYGYIKDWIGGDESHRAQNHQAILDLPPQENWPILSREMFAAFDDNDDVDIHFRTDVLHFGAACQGVEYEWDLWLQQFEKLLEQMYWVSAVVHLNTELNGVHQFTWVAQGQGHKPGEPCGNRLGEWDLGAMQSSAG